ncbi:MAG TPA: penicillin-binding protein 2 [Ktedonobacteraceae bacterium]|nr:penicillin-binding protein 2 [Ktedonobacteraceae bacterium]
MNISSNIRKLTNLFVLLFVALSAGLVYWQVIVAQPVTANIKNGRHCQSDAAPKRGRILDRNGVVLAYSKPATGLKRGSLCGYQRFYTDPQLASVLGVYIGPLFLSSGIEHSYNDYLSGQVGVTKFNNSLNQILHRPPVGDDIYLTIDERIQKIVEKAFDTPYKVDNFQTFASDKGSVIVTDPKTGEILAMLSRPGYDPNRFASLDNDYINQIDHDPTQPNLNRATSGLYVPGSTYKAVTLMAALDSGSSQLSDPFYNDPPGSTEAQQRPQAIQTRIGGEPFGPNGNNLAIGGSLPSFPINLDSAFSHSDNIVFAQVGAKMGAQSWLDYNQRFGVGTNNIKFDLPVAQSRVNDPGQSTLSVNQLAENSFGQGKDFVTPFQMSLFDDAIANNGTLMQPQLISKIVDPSGATLRSLNPAEIGTPIKDTTASQVRDAMYGVAQCGSGRFGFATTDAAALNQSPWQIIAKTGTGQLDNGPAQGWMFTQAPYTNPILSIVAMKENSGEGGQSTGIMIRPMYDQIFRDVYKLQPPTAAPQGDYTNGYCQKMGLLPPGL